MLGTKWLTEKKENKQARGSTGPYSETGISPNRTPEKEKPMHKLLKIFAPLFVGACGLGSAEAPERLHFPADISEMFGPSRAPNNIGPSPGNSRPGPGYEYQWYTTEAGCSYSRAQAPGYAPTWHLILNPHHIGAPTAHSDCPVQI